jgi:flavin-dependent dehydrogenase
LTESAANSPREADVVDVVIIGDGPAGAAAARLLALWSRTVVMLGRATARRPLAESLPPSCTKLFDQLGIRSAIDAAGFIRATGNTVQWAAGPKSMEPFETNALGYQVARDAFDAVLITAARAAGADVRSDATVSNVQQDTAGHWCVTYRGGSGDDAVHARWVLDCSGRSGVVARRGWRRMEPAARTIAVVGVWERNEPWPVDDDTHTLVESYDDGWAWSVPVSHTRRYVTVMLDPSITAIPGRASLAESYRREIARTTMLRALVDGATLTEAPWGCDASPYSAERTSDDRVLLVGDAASFVDPLSSFGIKKALASAWLASVAVHTALADERMLEPALELFARRERSMYDHLQRQSAALSRDAAGAHASDYWASRGESVTMQGESDLDVMTLRADPRIVGAFEELKRRQSVQLRPADSMVVVDRPIVRGNRIVLERHLSGPQFADPVRYCRSVDLVLMTQLAPRHDQVPDLFDAYNRVAPPAPLPDFLGALSTLVGLGMLSLA